MKSKLLSVSVDELNQRFKSNQSDIDELLKLKIKMAGLIRMHRQISNVSNKELAKVLEIDESNLSKIIIAKEEVLQKISIDLLIKHLMRLRSYNKKIDIYCETLFKLS